MKHLKYLVPLAAVAVISTLTLPAQTRETHRANRASSDSTFMEEAGQSGVGEVRMAQLALNKSTNQAVKNLANKLLTDHTQANENLKTIASAQSITLPSSMNASDQAEYDKVQALSGAAFDREYVKYEIQDHEKAIRLFQHESLHGTNPDVRTWAGKNLPVLQTHLKMAEDAQSAVK